MNARRALASSCKRNMRLGLSLCRYYPVRCSSTCFEGGTTVHIYGFDTYICTVVVRPTGSSCCHNGGALCSLCGWFCGMLDVYNDNSSYCVKCVLSALVVVVCPLLTGGGNISRSDVNAWGGRADAERAEQELELLRRVDSKQRQDSSLRHPAQVSDLFTLRVCRRLTRGKSE